MIFFMFLGEFVCVICQEQFYSEWKLRKHIKDNICNQITEKMCSFCGKHYNLRSSLKRHIHECRREPHLYCYIENCDYKTKRKTNLKRHLYSIHSIVL